MTCVFPSRWKYPESPNQESLTRSSAGWARTPTPGWSLYSPTRTTSGECRLKANANHPRELWITATSCLCSWIRFTYKTCQLVSVTNDVDDECRLEALTWGYFHSEQSNVTCLLCARKIWFAIPCKWHCSPFVARIMKGWNFPFHISLQFQLQPPFRFRWNTLNPNGRNKTCFCPALQPPSRHHHPLIRGLVSLIRGLVRLKVL